MIQIDFSMAITIRSISPAYYQIKENHLISNILKCSIRELRIAMGI